MKKYIELFRLKQWLKNIFVLPPLIFSLNLLHGDLLLRSLGALLSFCFISSSVYILNDLADREKDKLHPKKKERPIARGAVSVPAALTISAASLLTSLTIALQINFLTLAIISTYFLMNLLYSFMLKRIVIADVVTIAVGFLLRVAAGGAAVDVVLSRWLLLSTFFIALFLGFGKRKSEMWSVSEDEGLRRVMNQYGEQLLNGLIIATLTLTLITYALYVGDERTIEKLGTDRLIITVPLVAFGLFRYLYLLFQEHEGSDPGELILRDKPIIFTVLAWGIITLIVLYIDTIRV
ncbi:MAG: decaprenyl-phosphate phosphoribosyltransferase [Spirochaetales bacterium]|jgi:4-hydroxybenzoate polyprenyltransferase|nr:decaprenyl-phosphate phosphoribosyltransferase [Spirochaetales bacterium]